MKKLISLFTMIAFIVFSLSCFSTSMRLNVDAAKETEKIKILQVVTKSGESIEFSKEQPGRIYNKIIEGTAIRVTGELDKAYIQRKEKDKDGKILRIVVNIPLSEVEVIEIVDGKFDPVNTILFILGVGVVVGLIMLIGFAAGGGIMG